ncbi:MAG: hypothetical protein IH850_12450 [Acidobacteria bacterium]|nr:hypothetical protein [Acidobacteriota bacterium]
MTSVVVVIAGWVVDDGSVASPEHAATRTSAAIHHILLADTWIEPSLAALERSSASNSSHRHIEAV